MWKWKRKVGEGVVIGDDTLITVAEVRQSDGVLFKGTVTLGFSAPPGTLVQRAETYRVQNEAVPFPVFYRYIERDTKRVVGYTFNPPPESSRKNDSYYYEFISGYEDMEETDRQVIIHLFRQESEADAYMRGLETAEVVGVELGMIKEKRDNNWAVLVDLYHELGYKDDPNPLIRSFVEPNTRVMEALNNSPRRRTA